MPLLLAHAAAFALLAHCHYLVRPPGRQMWVAAELLLSAALWPACRWYVRRVPAPVWPWAAALGVVVALWWDGTAADTLWVFPTAAGPALRWILAAGHAAVLAAVYAGLATAVVRTDPRPTLPIPLPPPI